MASLRWDKQKTRFEGTWVVAPSGSGKTTLFKSLAAFDIAKVERGECSLIIMDSEGPLLNEIARLKVFDRVPLHIIDPAGDMGFNPFAIGEHTDKNISAAIRNIAYFMGSLLDSPMTAKQEGLFRRVARAVMALPQPTLLKLLRVMEGKLGIDFMGHDEWSREVQAFLDGPFLSDPDFRATREQLSWRIRRMFEDDPIFERIFADPRGLDFDTYMNKPGVTLIHTNRQLWDEEGVGIFGRLCLAQIKRVGFQRSPNNDAFPCFIYLDEAHLVVKNDQNAVKMLDGIRKHNVGLVFAHQRIEDQLSREVLNALYHNAATIIAANVRDPKLLASAMGHCDSALIENCPQGEFAIFIRGQTPRAMRVRVPYNALAKLPQRSYVPPPTPHPPPRREKPEKPERPEPQPASQSAPQQPAAPQPDYSPVFVGINDTLRQMQETMAAFPETMRDIVREEVDRRMQEYNLKPAPVVTQQGLVPLGKVREARYETTDPKTGKVEVHHKKTYRGRAKKRSNEEIFKPIDGN